MEELLRVDSLERRFGADTVLHGLDFRLARGEVLGLLGANGAGKTTCLRILSGNLAPTRGRVRIAGLDLMRRPVAARRRIGYLPERPPLYPEMRVDEYLVFCARLRRLPPASIAAAVQRTKRRCGLERSGRRLLGKLSKGYRQRAGLAQALIHEPDLVILDEPTDGLDPVQMREVRALIRDLLPGAGVLLSSHALGEVQAVCDRVLILRDGRALSETALDPASAGRRLHVRLRNSPTLSQLGALAAVATAEPLGSTPVTASGEGPPDPAPAAATGRFRIELADGHAADGLAQALVQAGWGLLELSLEQSDLERLFFDSMADAQGESLGHGESRGDHTGDVRHAEAAA